MISLTNLSTILRKPALNAHRRAAVRRSNVSLVALYGSQARKTSEHGAGCCQIAVPGAARRCAAACKHALFRAGARGLRFAPPDPCFAIALHGLYGRHQTSGPRP